MKSIRPYYLITFLLLLLACSDKLMIVPCGECVTDEPTSTDIKIRIESDNYSAVTLKVYRGPIEDNILLDSIVTSALEFSYKADINTHYTFSAEYKDQNGRTIIAIDSAYPRVRFETQQCDNDCYYIYDNKVNLRIRYE